MRAAARMPRKIPPWYGSPNQSSSTPKVLARAPKRLLARYIVSFTGQRRLDGILKRRPGLTKRVAKHLLGDVLALGSAQGEARCAEYCRSRNATAPGRLGGRPRNWLIQKIQFTAERSLTRSETGTPGSAFAAFSWDIHEMDTVVASAFEHERCVETASTRLCAAS